ncbi:MAG: GGDEF domain-containing protein [Zavarzinia sp.]|nr:GGDEF domain-containing protein [Zavarzinia sp.]
MPTQAVLLVEAASPHHRALTGIFAISLVAVTALALVRGDEGLQPVPAFLPAFAAMIMVINLITAYLILNHAPLAGRRHLLWLGTAYLYVAAIVPAQMTVFPGVMAPAGLFGAGPQSAMWLWVMWHCGFPLFVMIGMAVAYRERRKPAARPIDTREVVAAWLLPLALVGLFLLVVTKEHDNLPTLIVDNDYHALLRSPAGIAVVALNLGALATVITVLRGETMMALGLAVAMAAACADAFLTLEAGTRYSLGWYVSRTVALFTGLSVLSVYLRQVTWLYARISRRNIRLETEASTDEVTRLFNRRYFNRHLELALRLAHRRQPVTPTSLLMIDIDHFKAYNDRYGHQAGDKCLRQVAQAIATSARRPGDCAARFGGEEFAVVLPETDAEAADAIAASLAATVRDLSIPHEASATAPTVTVSIGLATAVADQSGDHLIFAADQALYRAKAQGRNRICRLTPAAPI